MRPDREGERRLGLQLHCLPVCRSTCCAITDSALAVGKATAKVVTVVPPTVFLCCDCWLGWVGFAWVTGGITNTQPQGPHELMTTRGSGADVDPVVSGFCLLAGSSTSVGGHRGHSTELWSRQWVVWVQVCLQVDKVCVAWP